MGISGSDLAIKYSIANVMRAGASRFGFYPPALQITIGGTRIEDAVIKNTVRVRDQIDEQPSTASFTCRLTPSVASIVGTVEGRAITMSLGTTANPIFSGRVLRSRKQLPRLSQRFPRVAINAVDHTWEMDTAPMAPVTYTDVSASSVMLALCGSTAVIEPRMANVSIVITKRDRLTTVLSKVMKQIGGYWFVDATRTIYAYSVASSVTIPAPLVNTPTQPFWNLEHQVDISQMRSRVSVFGRVTQLKEALDPFDSVAYVDDVDGFETSAGGETALIEFDGRQERPTTAPISTTSMTISFVGGVNPVPVGAPVQVKYIGVSNSARSLVADRVGSLTDIYGDLEDTTLSHSGAAFVGDGELALFDRLDETVTYETRDKNAWGGGLVCASITAPLPVHGQFIIQSVELSGFEGDGSNPMLFPVRRVTAGTFTRNLFDLLSRLRQGREGV